MDKINFLAKDDFPASSNTLDRLQKATLMVAALTGLGGVNYILSGCQKEGNQIAPGIIVLNGEILPFQGGTIQSKIAVQETKTQLEAFDVLYPEAYIDRVAVFSDLGEYNWGDLVHILTNKELEIRISEIRGEPIGMKIDWTGRLDRIPDNYLLADGRILKTVDYPELAYIYGKENEESFSLPDLRHMFIAGYDSTKTDYSSIGKTGGSEKVELKIENYPKHVHAYTDDVNAQGKFPSIEPGFPQSISGIDTNKSSGEKDGWGTVYNTGSVGGNSDGSTEPHENRPQFYVLAYIIKVKY